MQKRHHVIRDVGQSMLAAVRSELSAQKSKAKAFLATPTVEFLRKNQPCAVLYLYDLRPFIRINSGEKWELEEEIVDEDGETYVVRYGRPLEMQLKYLLTASAEELADEHEILALAMKTFLESPRLSREQLVGESFGSSDGLAISTDTDFDRLRRVRLGPASRSRLPGRGSPHERPRARTQQARPRAAHRRFRSVASTPRQRQRPGAGDGGEATAYRGCSRKEVKLPDSWKVEAKAFEMWSPRKALHPTRAPPP